MMVPMAKGPGFYHRVEKGQTLWALSRQYDIPVDKIIQRNRLPKSSHIETGQLIFIPKDKEDVHYTPVPEDGSKFSWPVKGRVISTFGSQREGLTNKGIHIAAQMNTDIIASQHGVVSLAEDAMKGYGKMIIIDHAGGYQTIYAHNAENFVQKGDKVKRNQVIAKVGSSGRASQPYLHFEIREKHKAKNPFHYLP